MVSPDQILITGPEGDERNFQFDNNHFDRYFGDGGGGGNNRVNLHIFKLMHLPLMHPATRSFLWKWTYQYQMKAPNTYYTLEWLSQKIFNYDNVQQYTKKNLQYSYFDEDGRIRTIRN